MTANDEIQILSDIIKGQQEDHELLKHEITRLENEIDRLTQENLDQARELGAKSEPVEYGC